MSELYKHLDDERKKGLDELSEEIGQVCLFYYVLDDILADKEEDIVWGGDDMPLRQEILHYVDRENFERICAEHRSKT